MSGCVVSALLAPGNIFNIRSVCRDGQCRSFDSVAFVHNFCDTIPPGSESRL